MEKNNKQTSETQGVEDVNNENIRTWIKNDLNKFIHFLNMIYTDQDMINYLADFVQGRIDNARHKEQEEFQQTIRPFTKPRE